MNNALKKFSEIDFVLSKFNPRTFYGKQDKVYLKYFNSIEELNKEFDLIDLVLNNIFKDEVKSDKISYHLSRISQLPDNKGNYSSFEIFKIKKFLINYSAINDLIEADIKNRFGISFDLNDVKNKLDVEEKDEETFYINEGYSEELRSLRRSISDINETLSKIKDDVHKELILKYNLDFRFRDFILVENSKASSYSTDEIYFETFDNLHLVVKPIYGKEFLDYSTAREKLYVEEKRIENGILNEISNVINEQWEIIQNKIESIRLFDRIFAKAELAKFTESKRPIIITDNDINIENGRFLLLESKCNKHNEKYQSLSIMLDKKVNVLHGSNMSGKTVALQSFTFFQILTQCGFFVPANKFQTQLFDRIHYIGENKEEKRDGLSSFGIEVEQLVEAIECNGKSKLFIIDEPARTTNSSEAVALLSSLIEYFSTTSGIISIIATHYTELPKIENVEYLGMKGIDWNLFEENGSLSKTIDDKIKLIHRSMSYEIEREDSKNYKNKDAIKIAKILGLNEKIIKLSKKYIEDGDK